MYVRPMKSAMVLAKCRKHTPEKVIRCLFSNTQSNWAVSSEALSNETILNTCLDAYMPVLYTLPVYCLMMQLLMNNSVQFNLQT